MEILPTPAMTKTHCLKKVGRYTIIKYWHCFEIHVTFKKDNEVIETRAFSEAQENIESAKFYSDCCLQAMIYHTLENKK